MKFYIFAITALLTSTFAHAQTPVSTIAPTLAKTPPMGWNSWNHFARRVTEQDVKNAAGDDLDFDVNEAERQQMAHGDELAGALGGLDAGETCDLKRIAFGVLRERGEDGVVELDEG